MFRPILFRAKLGNSASSNYNYDFEKNGKAESSYFFINLVVFSYSNYTYNYT